MLTIDPQGRLGHFHPEDVLDDFGERFDVLYRLAQAIIWDEDHTLLPDLEDTLAHGIRRLHDDFEQAQETIVEWPKKVREGQKAQVAT